MNKLNFPAIFLRKIFFKGKPNKNRLFKVTKRIKRIVEKKSFGICLDAGCGTGEYLNFFKCKQIVGLDLTKNYLKEINLLKFPEGKLMLVEGDIRNIPFANDYFDFILCSEVFEYIPEKDAKKTFEELERVCKQNAIIVISVPNKNFIFSKIRDLLYNNEYGKPNIQYTNMGRLFSSEELEKEGFKVHGCFGYVSRSDTRFGFIFDILDFFAWYFPNLGGTLIGIKQL